MGKGKRGSACEGGSIWWRKSKSQARARRNHFKREREVEVQSHPRHTKKDVETAHEILKKTENNDEKEVDKL